jgi:hypothetical protein
MGKHRLQGKWYSCRKSTVVVTCAGEVFCTVRGTIGKVNRWVDTGIPWDQGE